MSLIHCKWNIFHSSLGSSAHCLWRNHYVLVKQLRITFKRLLTWVWQCVCVCVANFTNRHMILNVVLVIKLYLGCELIWLNYTWDVNWFDQIVSLVRVGQQGLQCCIYVKYLVVATTIMSCACFCLVWVQQLFTCVFSVNIPVDLCLYTFVYSPSLFNIFLYI